MISEIGCFLLSSCDITEITLKELNPKPTQPYSNIRKHSVNSTFTVKLNLLTLRLSSPLISLLISSKSLGLDFCN